MTSIKKNENCLTLFLTFCKIGLFTFGGGYAMIPLIQNAAVTEKKWISDEDLLDIIAISESTPGPIAINAATFIGYRLHGITGAICATGGVVLPSFLIIFLIAVLLEQFQDIPAVQHAFWGIRAGVLALIAKACLRMYRQCPKTAHTYLLIAFAFISGTMFNLKTIYILLICAGIGCITHLYHTRRTCNGQVPPDGMEQKGEHHVS